MTYSITNSNGVCLKCGASGLFTDEQKKEHLVLNPACAEYFKIKIRRGLDGENKEDGVLRTSFYANEKVLLQQVADGNFVLYDGFSFIKVPEYGIGNTFIRPLEGEEMEKGFVLLAEFPMEYGSASRLVEEIKEFSRAYLDIPEDFRTFASYYVLLTWVYDRGNTIPYLRFMGDTGCGKSRALEVFASLCYNYIPVNGAVNSAPMFRVIEKWKGTLGFEESDFRKSDESNDIIKVINCGFEKGRPIIRCHKNKPHILNFFDPYCPKIFSARKPFEDTATEGRCLTHVMQETKRTDILPILPQDFYKNTKELRNKLLKFRLENYRRINPDALLPLPECLEPRLKQFGAPFSMVFSQEGEDWKNFTEFLLTYQKQVKEIRLNSESGIILTQLVEMAGNGSDAIICKEVAETLKIPISKVSRELRSLGFSTENRHRMVNEKRKTFRAICIPEDKWDGICRRYLSDPIPIPIPLCQARPACQHCSSGTLGTDGAPNEVLQ